MTKKAARAVTLQDFYRFERELGGRSDAPPPHDTLLNRLATFLAHKTGLSDKARRRLMTVIRATATPQTDRLAHLYHLQNLIVDGGCAGLWTSLRICAGAV